MLRNRAGLTQSQLGELLNLKSARMVRNWEGEFNLPSPDRLRLLIKLYLERQVFLAGKEREEVRQLWQLVKDWFETHNFNAETYPIFDESWFTALLVNSQAAQPKDLRPVPAAEPLETQTRLIPHNLPHQLSSFVGRSKEISELKKLLTQDKARLLTLVGPGGCGKSRLSLQVAEELLADFQDGLWLVELAPLHNPALIPQVIARTLGLGEQPGQTIVQTLAQHLRQRNTLLVLDNCEHLVEECSQVVESLLKQTAHLQILATSREGLGIAGEVNYLVPSLSMPQSAEIVMVEKLANYEALQLFVERAKTASPQFRLEVAEIPALVQTCRRLDGIPLALELAAARVRMLTLTQVQAGLDDRFQLLTSANRHALPRHQTLRAMVDWSYNLLSEEEKELLNRASIFAGSWNLAAAEGVCGSGPALEKYAILDRLTSLANKSMLVVSKQEGEVRYRLLETIRQYGLEKLQAAGEEGSIRERHLSYYAGLVEGLQPKLIGPEQAQTLRSLDPELDNLRSAIEYGLKQEQFEQVFKLTVSLFWEIRGYHTEGYPYLDQALTLPGAIGAKRGKALFWAGHFLTHQGKLPQAVPYFEESLALSKALADNDLVWHATLGMGDIYMDQENFAEAQHYYEECLEAAQTKDEWSKTTAQIHLGNALLSQKKYELARNLYEEAVSLARKTGNLWAAGCVLRGQAHQAMLEEDYPAAHRYLDEAIPYSEKINLLPLKSDLLNYRIMLFSIEDRFAEALKVLEECLDLGLEGDLRVSAPAGLLAAALLFSKIGLINKQSQVNLPEVVARLCGATVAFLPGIVKASNLPHRTYYEQALKVAQSGLDTEAFEKAFARGQAMSLEEAIALIRQALAEN
jgi:predicted ATPase/transcriptional regulator with XRE-family HTH domain